MKKIVSSFLLIITIPFLLAAREKTDAHIIGHVVCQDKHVPFVNVFIEGTTIGTVTDETGHFRIADVPEGTHIVKASAMGYKQVQQTVTISTGQTIEINFNIQKDVLGLEEVVITGDRNEKRRKESSVIVNTITPRVFNATQSKNLNESLNFIPGLRTENNCQNCGFNQVRMNGLDGPYSQVLINGRPIFSGLAGVYGLEMIPSNMIERVEVIRGGGSALYGSNAIAGTINVILKDPVSNVYQLEASTCSRGVGVKTADQNSTGRHIDFNSSLISNSRNSGVSIYGTYKHQDPFDANDDGFSDLVTLNNTTIGTRFFHRFGHRSKISADFFNIREDRRGGDKFDLPEHEANIAESVKHNILTGAVTYDKFFREVDLLSVYGSVQNVTRDSYYGARQSLRDYGHTKNITYHLGGQYKAVVNHSTFLIGLENQGGWLNDKKLGYPDVENAYMVRDSLVIPHVSNTQVADQYSNIFGTFLQYEYKWQKLTTSLGLRYDHYEIGDNNNESNPVAGDVISPRVNILYNFTNFLQGRLSYSQGYRAPQIFDEDLHIETSGSRKVLHRNSPDLKQETSQSYMASLDFNQTWNEVLFRLLFEGFYTRLNHPFSNQFGEPDQNGTVVYTRVNAKNGALVKGSNLELKLVPVNNLQINSGLTVQTGKYDEPQEFGSKEFFRSPSAHGFLIMDWNYNEKFCVNVTGTYTGKMIVPYFGPGISNPEEGKPIKTDPFYNIGLQLKYDIKLNGNTVRIFTGIKNIFNAFQDDLDAGINRDPGYVYGPSVPRTIYVGFKFGNRLK